MMVVSLGVPQHTGDTIIAAVKSNTNPTMYTNEANPGRAREVKGECV
jgi:hypothetical protein